MDTTSTASASRILAYTGAVALLVAAAWSWLAGAGITVAAAPTAGPDAPADLATRDYYRWFATTVPQERVYSLIGIVGFACLATVAVLIRDRLSDGDSLTARAGVIAIGIGSGLWLVGMLLEIGGHRAVEQMATHTNPPETVASIAFTVDTTTTWFTAGALVLSGLGLLALAWTARRRQAWAGFTVLCGLLLLVTAGVSIVDDAGTLLLVDGVAVPVWLVWTGRTYANDPGAKRVATAAAT